MKRRLAKSLKAKPLGQHALGDFLGLHLSQIKARIPLPASVIKPEEPIKKMRSASCRPYLFEPPFS